jgi:phospholipase/carboxylesterase
MRMAIVSLRGEGTVNLTAPPAPAPVRICPVPVPVLSVGAMDIHGGQRVLRGGAPLKGARAALVLLHGRGASAEDILPLGEEVSAGVGGVSLLAPQASGNAWYPQRFLAPLAQNEPHLGSALGVVTALVADIVKAGVGAERIVLAGFSQGACLALEFAARNARRYGGVAGLSGALIGPPGGERDVTGDLAGTPVYLGCSDRDFHIPLGSVRESAAIFRALGARVTESIFPGMGHTVNAEELAAVQEIVAQAAAGA